ncbi:MAG: CHAT domain-containing protein [Acidobacteria bacterium]|nr:CHAT domain-containing protein [Acidobacteriota bacterium]
MKVRLCIRAIAFILFAGSLLATQDNNAEKRTQAERLFNAALEEFQQQNQAAYGRAHRLAEQAIMLSAAIGNHVLEAEAARLLTIMNVDQGQHKRAEDTARRILDAARLSKSLPLEAMGTSFLALAHLRQQRYENAFLLAHRADYLYNSQDIQNQESPAYSAEKIRRDRVLNLYTLGNLYNFLGRPDVARVFLSEGLTRSSGLPRTEMLITKELGAVYFQLGDYAKALGYLRRSLELVDPMTGVNVAQIHLMISDAYSELRDYEPAESHAKQGLRWSLRFNNPDLIYWAYYRLGEIYLARQDDKNAESVFSKISSAKEAYPLIAGAGRVYERPYLGLLGLGKIYEKHGQLDRALEHYEEAVKVVEDFRRAQKTGEDRLSLFRRILEPFERAAQTLVKLHFKTGNSDQNYADRAFAATERIRNRIFAEQLAAAWNQTNHGPEQLTDRLNIIERDFTSLSRTLLNNRLSQAEQKNIQEKLEKLEIEKSSARRQIAIYQNLSSSNKVEEWSIDRVQQLLARNTALLEFTSGEPAAVFVITADKAELVPLPDLKNLADRTRTYFDLLSASDTSFGAFELDGAQALYRDLLEPALRVLPKTISHLIISPSSVLELLPLESLVDESGRFLVEKYAISYIPSASTLHILRQKDSSTNRRQMLAFADPDYETSDASPIQAFFESDEFKLTPLPYTRTEVESLARIVGPGNADILVGAQADEGVFKATDLSQYRIIHIATHGIASRAHPSRSALLFTLGADRKEDGFLQVREIYDLRLNADLVVLSACETGRGDEIPGEGIHGLSRAFFFAGARSLVASMWKVPDQPTAELMKRFYQYLRQGLSKAESLRLAKVDAIRETGSHPNKWAGFVLLGEGDGVVTFQSGATQASWIIRYILPIIIVGTILIVMAHIIGTRSSRKGGG